MALTEDWKSAKHVFEEATKKKKPTEKFLGFIRKGTGIEAALKKADAAKTAGDLRKALADFKKEADDYTKTLKTAAADPKSVKAEDKAAYVLNVQKLEKSLEALVTTGETMATSLDGSDKKAKVDPKLLKLELEWKAYLDLRKSMKGKLTTVLSDYNKQAAEIDTCVTKAIEHTAEAKKHNLARNSAEAATAIKKVEGFKQLAESTQKKIEDDWEERSTKLGGEMMTCRGDKSPPDGWATDKKAAAQKESNDAFGAYDAVQKQIQSLKNSMKLKIAGINLTLEEAQTYSGAALDPKIFVTRLAGLQQELDTLGGGIGRKLETMKNNIISKRPEPKNPGMLKQFTMIRDAEIKSQQELETKIAGFAQLLKRANLVPQDLRKEKTIEPAYKKFVETATKTKTDLAEFKKEQQTFINDLNKYISALG